MLAVFWWGMSFSPCHLLSVTTDWSLTETACCCILHGLQTELYSQENSWLHFWDKNQSWAWICFLTIWYLYSWLVSALKCSAIFMLFQAELLAPAAVFHLHLSVPSWHVSLSASIMKHGWICSVQFPGALSAYFTVAFFLDSCVPPEAIIAELRTCS